MTFSASRIQTWMNCNRRGAWEYICGYQEPATGATNLGQLVHAYLQKLHNTQALPDRTDDIGSIAAEALPYIGDLSLALGGRSELSFSLEGRHKWRGFIDLYKPGIVVDYKTTGDFAWAKTEDELAYDPQALLYAEFAHRQESFYAVETRWIYLRKRRPYKAWPVVVYVTRDHAAQGFKALESYADELQDLADKAPEDPGQRHLFVLQEAKPNYSHCDAYGGCPHKTRCNVPFFSATRENNKTMTLFERLQAMANGEPAGNPHPMAARTDIPPEPVVEKSEAGSVTAFSPEFLAQPVTPNQINPPKRGRPRKNPAPTEAKVVFAEPALSMPSEPVHAAVETRVTMIEEPVAPAQPVQHRIGTLYVGCLPRTGQTVDFDTLIARAKVAIGPQDWRTHEYGKGNGLLLDMFQEIVQHDKPISVVVIDSRVPEANLCLSYLRSISEQVVEGVR